MAPASDVQDPDDLAQLFLQLNRDLNRRLAKSGRWRCVRAIPRIDGTAYFEMQAADPSRAMRIDWCAPKRLEPGGSSVGRFQLHKSARQVDAREAESVLALVSTAVGQWLQAPDAAALRFGNPLAPDDFEAVVEARLPPGRARWAAWTLVSKRSPGGRFVEIAFDGPPGKVDLAMGPPGWQPGNRWQILMEHPSFTLALGPDARSQNDRQLLANQVERYLGFSLARALPDLTEPVAVRAQPEPPAAEPAEQEPEEELDGEFYLYLNKCVCNANCIFCSRSKPERKKRIESEIEAFDYAEELASIQRTLAERRNKGAFRVGGHEPSIYPTLIPILEAAVRAGFAPVALDTNGLALSDPELVARLERVGVAEVRLPIYGVSPRVHDAITGVPGSLHRSRQAIANLERTSIKVVVGSLVLRQNIEELGELFELYASFSAPFVMPVSADPDEYRRVCPRLSQVPGPILDRIGDLYIPCVFPQRPNWAQTEVCAGHVVLDSGRLVAQENERYMSREQRLQIKAKLERCESCSQESRCTGIYPMYFRAFGTEEFEPI